MSDFQITTEMVKATPPVAVSAAVYVGGMPLSAWVALLTIVYVVLQIGLLLPRYIDGFKAWWKERQER